MGNLKVQLVKAIALLDGPKHLSTVSFQLHQMNRLRRIRTCNLPSEALPVAINPLET